MKLLNTLLCMQSIVFVIAGGYGIERQKLVFSTYNYLKEIDLDTGVVRTLTTQNDFVYSLAYDSKERYLYVPRYNTGDIVRFSYPSNHTVVFETIVDTIFPVGVAFDSVNRHFYWTQTSFSGRIMRCNPEGSSVTIVLNENKPTALTLDIQNRFVVGVDTFIC